jgi:hypothetical protein
MHSGVLIAILCCFLVSRTSGFAQKCRRATFRSFRHASLGAGSQHDLNLLSASKSSVELPPNEFSRKLQLDRVLKIKRDYLVNVEATQAECTALADRFDLSDIAKLQASLSLRQERIGGSKTGTNGVEVEGTVTATVTQRCVRTNEDFEVDLEFPLYCIVRPVLPLAALMKEPEKADRKGEDGRAHKGSYRGQDRNFAEMDMMDLQRMLQQDISSEDDDLMEGQLDVGELVAQLFWLKLDPYPKKPGTDFFSASISG